MGEVKDRGKGKDSVKECEEFLELAVVRGERERERESEGENERHSLEKWCSKVTN